MPVSYATLQIYDQYLTTYGSSSKRSSRYDSHDSKELKDLYSTIQLKNRFAPLYLKSPSAEEIHYAINLKEQAKSLHETIDTLSSDDEQQLFSTKTAYSDHPESVSVSYAAAEGQPVSSYNNKAPAQFTLSVQEYATPQRNISSFLSSSQSVMMPEGSYSFDLINNKLHYELQFDLRDEDTHESLQQRLMRLINNSELGVHARVLEEDGRSALEITSDAYGVPAKGGEHFLITDENTSHNSGMVHYLGLNKIIEPATNASYTIDGEAHSSYRNTFEVYDSYEITLHPEYPLSPDEEIKVGLYPDLESLTHNIRSFVESYNSFLESTRSDSGNSLRLDEDISRILSLHRSEISQYSITVGEDYTLSYPDGESASEDTLHGFSQLQNFGNHLIRKLNSIVLDPMEYLNRQICSYPNPATSYINPYVTSIYSGMLFNTYV